MPAVEGHRSADFVRLQVDTNRVQLQQVILNLTINAVEAMAEVAAGSRELVISTASVESDRILVAVQDSGPGLDVAGYGPARACLEAQTSNSVCRPPSRAHGNHPLTRMAAAQSCCGRAGVPPVPRYSLEYST